MFILNAGRDLILLLIHDVRTLSNTLLEN